MGKRSPKNLSTEQILQYVCRKYINVDKGKRKCVNPLVRKVLTKLTDTMKLISPLFNTMFRTYLYAGSSYDGLKVGKPDEFDIDLKLNLLKIRQFDVIPSDRSGFVHIQMKDLDVLPTYYINEELKSMIDENNYLSQEKIKQWMESIVSKAVNKISDTKAFEKLEVKYKVNGPAVTVIICNEISIDLVAVIQIPRSKWPAPPVRQFNTLQERRYLLVPKPPKKSNLGDNVKYPERYWRLSFPEQERFYMFNLNNCKPALRVLKKLRDSRTQNIPSYYIKTIFLWEIERRPSKFWNQSLTNIFLEMLQTYINYLSAKNLPYYWDSNNNLIEAKSEINIENIKDYLQGMIKDIELNKNSDPFIMIKYILPDNEYKDVCIYYKKCA